METPVSTDRVRQGTRLSDRKSATAVADDLVIARRRMRHLAPWDIEPLPVMHSVAGASAESPPPEQREQTKELALHLLAVHMWQAAAKTALR